MCQTTIQRYLGDDRDWRVLVVLGGCVYEIVAILSRKIPTITSIAHRLRVHHVGRFALWLLFGWLIEHLFGEGR
jgi:hypothetical protein